MPKLTMLSNGMTAMAVAQIGNAKELYYILCYDDDCSGYSVQGPLLSQTKTFGLNTGSEMDNLNLNSSIMLPFLQQLFSFFVRCQTYVWFLTIVSNRLTLFLRRVNRLFSLIWMVTLAFIVWIFVVNRTPVLRSPSFVFFGSLVCSHSTGLAHWCWPNWLDGIQRSKCQRRHLHEFQKQCLEMVHRCDCCACPN